MCRNSAWTQWTHKDYKMYSTPELTGAFGEEAMKRFCYGWDFNNRPHAWLESVLTTIPLWNTCTKMNVHSTAVKRACNIISSCVRKNKYKISMPATNLLLLPCRRNSWIITFRGTDTIRVLVCLANCAL